MTALTAQRLTDAYRIAQAEASGQASGAALVAFNTLLDPSALDTSFVRYLAVMRQVIDAYRRKCAASAGAYYLTHREALDVFADVPDVAYAGLVDAQQAAISLLVTGPVAVKQSLARGVDLAEAMRLASGKTAGAVYRLVANGGRDTIFNTVARDRLALGWQRVTDGHPCAFCAMLASRGPVYQTAESAGEGKHFHNGCGCHPEPVYSRDQEWPGNARQYSDLWASSTTGYSGRAAINAFRRAYTAQS